MRKQRSEEGFTLIESLLVLTIFMLLSITAIVNVKPVQEHFIITQFFEQFEKDILFAQQHAITEHTRFYFVYSHNAKSYSIRKSGTVVNKIISRNFDSSITISNLTLPNTFSFDSQGNISDSGSLLVEYLTHKYLVKFYLGKGRFHVEKL
ncbi:competence type IV pilus minor pilin ComGD [Metabacillus sp. RGM 3146]|uniref:competence type IV pilus minor pilin ComGD n=1 Tax=Metabacillus sp. RGM 3146 TaxID=3401092 RepID=UPI003B9B6D15